jgi:hypothetical protein
MTYVSTFAYLIYFKISVKHFLLYLIRREVIFRGKSRIGVSYPDPYVMTSAMNWSTAQMAFENGI